MAMDGRDHSNDGNPQMRRRTVVAGLAVTSAAVGAAALSERSACAEASTSIELGSLAPGVTLPGTEVRVITIYPVTFGALPVVLESRDGNRFQVDVLARDTEGPQGVGNTEHYSVYVSNRGDGGTSTDETQGLAAMALARVLEAEGASLPTLLTMRGRQAEHPNGTFGVPLA